MEGSIAQSVRKEFIYEVYSKNILKTNWKYY